MRRPKHGIGSTPSGRMGLACALFLALAAPGAMAAGAQPAAKTHRTSGATPAAAGVRDVHPVSTSDYNLLRFDQPVAKAILPPGAPLAGAPYYLDGNRVLLLRFAPDHGKPVQLIVEMQDGSTRTLRLVPRRGISGQVVNVEGIRAPGPAIAPVASMNPNARYLPALAAAVQGETPPGYRIAALGPELEYDRLTAIPIAAWKSRTGTTRIDAYRIDAKTGRRLVLDPAQFYRPASPQIAASLLTGSVADSRHHPTLYLVTRNGG